MKKDLKKLRQARADKAKAGKTKVEALNVLLAKDTLTETETAQLAALEITYGVETGRIAEMLESVRNSTLRTAEVLEHLIWHSSRTSGVGDSKK